MEQKQVNLSIVIPAYNEAEGIAPVLGDIRRTLEEAHVTHEIIVVDDGSSDGTADAARACDGVSVISLPLNGGYGNALLAGFARARYDHIAIIDADGSYPPRELLKLLPFADRFDMLIGARHGKNYWGTMFKFPIRLVFLWLSEFATGQKIPDANSGLRIIRKDAIPSGPALCRGFSFSTTLTLMFLSTGKFVKFIPIDYLVRTGHSKIRFLRDTLRTGQVIVESLIYYNPLKLVLLLSVLPFASFILFLALFFTNPYNYGLLGWASVSMLGCFIFFLFGALMDIIRLTRGAVK
jgi:glycosyltransferase involved in cell wall biosynthesis